MKKQAGFTVMELAAVGAFLLWLSVGVAVVCVAWHFIHKFW